MAVANEHANALGPQPQMGGMLPGSKRKKCAPGRRVSTASPSRGARQVTCHIFLHSSAKTNTATWRTTQPVLILKRYHLWVQTSAQSSLSQSPTATEIGLLMQLPICRSAASGIFQDSSRRSCGSSAYECGSRPELHTSHSRTSSAHPNPRSSSFFTEKPRLS